MTKKALITDTLKGPNNEGFKVAEVVEVGQEFQVTSAWEWKDCPDTIESFKYWYNPSTNEYKKLPEALDPAATVGDLAFNDKFFFTEQYVWNWDLETWTKEPIIMY